MAIKLLTPLIFLSLIIICSPLNYVDANNQFSSQIAFINREADGDNLVILDPITHTQKFIAKYLNSRIVGPPLWSLDCKYLVLDQIDNNNNKSILRVDLVTNSDASKLPISEMKITAWFPKWSPDGQKLLFQGLDWSAGLRNTDIYTLSIETGKIMNLTNSDEPDFDPSWSPDGKKYSLYIRP